MRWPISSGKRPLDEEEERLWRLVTRGDAPLKKRKRVVTTPVAPKTRIGNTTSAPPLPPISVRELGALATGFYAGIDKNTADRFRKGKTTIDATLDLHGMTREQAHYALSSFIHAQYTLGSRCLLVITGKGYRGEGQGVLRELLPHWLDEPSLRPFILALDVAKPPHGGSGAFYVLLRRKR